MSTMVGGQQQAISTQDDPPVTSEEPPKDRNGLANSSIDKLSPEMRLAVIKFLMQPPRRVAIVSKAVFQQAKATAYPNEPSLVYTTKTPLSKTCYDMHTACAEELRSQVMSYKIPTLVLHVHDFDFTPFTNELFSKFEDTHREYFNELAGAVRIHLTITESFLAREPGEAGRNEWLAKRETEMFQKKSEGLIQWLEWRKAEQEAGKGLTVTYVVERKRAIENVEDMEALRLFMLLFDPYSEGEGEISDIVEAVIDFVEKVNKEKRVALQAQREEQRKAQRENDR
jgi:hypothetical protein